MMSINDNTPVGALTVGQLKEILAVEKVEPITQVQNFTDNKYIYGLKGIRDEFAVSHATAQKYKDGILKEAVQQVGRKIIVDREKAHQLFANSGRAL
ncbi:DUF3853 family protein [Plebeiibacterium marinum]|uniref:DUF3853 family protein n=1 Tax=Plebeiibacterium marinum TaxID=2992111 RepID=A0AAE3SK27_9BACT|nr:DUF3853 family protein [Plebeiobacterium marinum]MCW3806124.1 DUF3853 family protein [Plebeiobacterium marinum]